MKKLETDGLPRQKKYEDQERKLAGRNSYSKTDVDATFMRMKDDPMKNGQLKPGYNLQMGTEGQFVVGFSVHQRPGDPGCLVPHLQGVKEKLGRLPKNVMADSAYGSEENYAYLAQEQVGNYLKYNTFGQEQRARYKPNAFAANQMKYDPEKDELICPAGKRLRYQYTSHPKTENGYRTERRCYQAEDLPRLSLKSSMHQSEGEPLGRVELPVEGLEATSQTELYQVKKERSCVRYEGSGSGKCVWKAQGRLGLPQILTQGD